MIIRKTARPTLTAVEMDLGDELRFTLADGTTRTITIESTRSQIDHSTLEPPLTPRRGARTVLRCHCVLCIDGVSVELVRWIGSDRSFYEPWKLMGLRVWFDVGRDLFDHLTEDHGACKPRKAVRLAVQDASLRICPPQLHAWCPLPEGGLRIDDCYDSCDCWCGPYFGADAHGGLDINHPAGTPIWTPIAFDEQYLFNRLESGDNNNRWRGIRRWDDGSSWVLQVHHVIRLRVEENRPLEAGLLLADGAGVRVGSHQHSHFVFKVVEPGANMDEAILLDPWILFHQMYRDHADTIAPR
ncbi:MAG: hypothetical protein ACLFV7_06165 [Phycisphaerae bacterium]